MTPRSVFSVHALIAAGFAIPLLVAPVGFLAMYGAKPDGLAVYLARLLGAAFTVFAVVTWLIRDAPEGRATDALCAAFAIGSLVGLLAALTHQLTDPSINAYGWSTVAVYAGLSVAYAVLWTGRADRRRKG
jgi:hypothetical protein